jgi:hypothetical protein
MSANGKRNTAAAAVVTRIVMSKGRLGLFKIAQVGLTKIVDSGRVTAF